jgi:D-beta-D-heptose 7-phosphate kinase/D-beta-D-heptose 1-phosphate adenosyltransferase
MARLPIPSAPILVVGDIMCDHYVWGDVERISPEAPVQVLRWEREADKPGGAANAALNLAALGCRVRLVGVIGNDEPGRWLLRTLKRAGVDTTGVIRSKDRPTTLKTRVMARGQHMLRIDREIRTPLSPRDERRVIAAVKRSAKTAAAAVCSDYDKGVLTRRVFRAVVERRGRRFVTVDPKSRNFRKYRGADLLTPNEKELADAAPGHVGRSRDSDVKRRAELLMRTHGFKAILVTRGSSGMDLFESSRGAIRRTHIPTLQRHEVFDVTGAGDTVAAVLTMAAAAGVPLAESARIANAAAGIVVGMVGTAVAEPDTLARMISGEASQARSKVLPPAALARRIAEARKGGSTVVFTSGPFDSLGVDDLRTLQRARARGEVLVVGVNGDGSSGLQRAELLAALRFVDYVTLMPKRGAGNVARMLRPDIVV